MGWVYRNITTARTPPCPVCGFNIVKAPPTPSGKYECEAAKCRARFQATWKPDEKPSATTLNMGGGLSP